MNPSSIGGPWLRSRPRTGSTTRKTRKPTTSAVRARGESRSIDQRAVRTCSSAPSGLGSPSGLGATTGAAGTPTGVVGATTGVVGTPTGSSICTGPDTRRAGALRLRIHASTATAAATTSDASAAARKRISPYVVIAVIVTIATGARMGRSAGRRRRRSTTRPSSAKGTITAYIARPARETLTSRPSIVENCVFWMGWNTSQSRPTRAASTTGTRDLCARM